MNTIEIIDAIKARLDLPSDYAVHKVLGVTHQQIANYRKGRSYLGDEAAVKAAELLDLPAGYVLACVHAERTTDAATRKVWDRVAAVMKKAGTATAAVAFATLLSQQGDAHAYGLKRGAASVTESVSLYIMSTHMDANNPLRSRSCAASSPSSC